MQFHYDIIIDGCIVVFVAVKSGNFECVRLLVEAGCDLNKQLYCGTTALHQAASEGMTRVRRMVSHGYDSCIEVKIVIVNLNAK